MPGLIALTSAMPLMEFRIWGEKESSVNTWMYSPDRNAIFTPSTFRKASRV